MDLVQFGGHEMSVLPMDSTLEITHSSMDLVQFGEHEMSVLPMDS